jgi:hypothetical protein
MGAHISYSLVIYHLVSLKRQFHLITAEKFRGVIKELSNYDIHPNSENDHLPDNKQLAEKFKCPQVKINKILKELLENLISSFNDHPLTIENTVHIVYVSPYIDPEEKNSDWIHMQWQKAISISMVLPVTPRIGEHVEISFGKLSYGWGSEDKYYDGYVHDVRHKITGTT